MTNHASPAAAISPRDPQKLGPYSEASPGWASDLRTDFATAQMHSSAARIVREAARRAPDGWAITKANAGVACLRDRERAPGRFESLQRAHDLREGAEVLVQRLRRIVEARRLHTLPRSMQDIGMQGASCTAVGDTFEFVVAVAVNRWIPGMRNVVHRLEPRRRVKVGLLADRGLRQFLLLVDRLTLVWRGMEWEASRWKDGIGTMEVALLQWRCPRSC
ncbi:MAG: hypothetical protein H0W48_03270 [Methylibium sp.]|nr:hypothetical protein [Methylibium sp.]MBA3623482.1 hypothetical protein [Methylibium sp.]